MNRIILAIALLVLPAGCGKPNTQQIAVADLGAVAASAGRTYFATACSSAKMAADPSVKADCKQRAAIGLEAKDAMEAAAQHYRSNPTANAQNVLDAAVCAYVAVFPSGSLDPTLISQAGCH